MFRASLKEKGGFWHPEIDYPGMDPDVNNVMFLSESSANLYIRKHKKEYLLRALRDYVAHKKKIYENSRFYYRTAHKRESIRIVEDLTGDLSKHQSLEQICKRILQVEDHLRRILPHSSNHSSKSSLINLNGIIFFARRELGRPVTEKDQYLIPL